MEDRVEPFSSVIGINIFLLKLSGVLGGRRQFLLAISFLCLSTYSVSYTYKFLARTSGLDEAMEFFTLIISFVGGQARYVILLLSRRRFLRILRLCENLWQDLEPEEKDSLRRYVDKTKRLTYYYLYGCAFTILLYILASIFAAIDSQVLAGNETIVRNLPYAFVLDVQESPFYEILYGYQVLSVVDVGLVCVATDTVGPVLIIIACAHLRIIQQRILSIGEEVTKDDPASNFVRENAGKKLSDCVRYHQTILQFCRDVEKMTNVIFLSQLLGSTYNISLTGFKLAGNDPDKFKYTTQLSIAVIQLFLCNWPADLLVTEGEALANAAYFTSWYNYSTKLRKSINIIIMRSQRQIRLTAGNFVSLSLETFASMISSAASFFTVISNLN